MLFTAYILTGFLSLLHARHLLYFTSLHICICKRSPSSSSYHIDMLHRTSSSVLCHCILICFSNTSCATFFMSSHIDMLCKFTLRNITAFDYSLAIVNLLIPFRESYTRGKKFVSHLNKSFSQVERKTIKVRFKFVAKTRVGDCSGNYTSRLS